MASKILIYQTAFWGDLLLSAPLLKRVRDLFPDAEIHLVCRKGFGALMTDLRLADVVYEYDKSKDPSLLEWVRNFQEHFFDLLICPHQSIRSMLAVSQIRARRKIGFWNFWNFWILNLRVHRAMELPDYLRQLELLAPIDPWVRDQFRLWKARHPAQQSRSDLRLGPVPVGVFDSIHFRSEGMGENDSQGLSERLRWMAGARTILIAPGSQWNTKRWTLNGFRTLTETLLGRGFQVAFVGGGGDSQIVQNLGLKDSENVHDWTGQTTPSELFVLFGKASALVTNDSGPMHLASLAGCPAVAIFGPTTLELGYQPLNSEVMIIQENLSCRPCGLHGHDRCPLGHHNCMKQIAADRVLRGLESLIPEIGPQ